MGAASVRRHQAATGCDGPLADLTAARDSTVRFESGDEAVEIPQGCTVGVERIVGRVAQQVVEGELGLVGQPDLGPHVEPELGETTRSDGDEQSVGRPDPRSEVA